MSKDDLIDMMALSTITSFFAFSLAIIPQHSGSNQFFLPFGPEMQRNLARLEGYVPSRRKSPTQ
jgi:hypothetical protein